MGPIHFGWVHKHVRRNACSYATHVRLFLAGSGASHETLSSRKVALRGENLLEVGQSGPVAVEPIAAVELQRVPAVVELRRVLGEPSDPVELQRDLQWVLVALVPSAQSTAPPCS